MNGILRQNPGRCSCIGRGIIACDKIKEIREVEEMITLWLQPQNTEGTVKAAVHAALRNLRAAMAGRDD